MAPEPGSEDLPWLAAAIEAARARIAALDECDRELTIALLSGRDGTSQWDNGFRMMDNLERATPTTPS